MNSSVPAKDETLEFISDFSDTKTPITYCYIGVFLFLCVQWKCVFRRNSTNPQKAGQNKSNHWGFTDVQQKRNDDSKSSVIFD